MVMTDEYLELQKRLKRIESIYFHAYCEYITFNELDKLRAPDLLGKEEAGKNLEILNHYPSFFQSTIEALRISFLTKTAKIVDIHRDSLHLESLIDYIEENRDRLNLDDFIERVPQKPFQIERAGKRRMFTSEDISVLRTKLKEAGDIRKNVKTYRDQHLSHEDLKQKKVDIHREDIDELFRLIGEILNSISRKVDNSTTTFLMAEKDCKRDVKNLIDNLRLGYESRRRIRKSTYS